MKKMLLAVLLGAGLCGLYAAENPALELFGDDITFYVSFDEGNGTADLADGSEKPVPIGSVTYADGVFGGKALRTGLFQYQGAGNADLSRAGTIVLWLTPENWPAERPDAQAKEPGFNAFHAVASDYQFLVSKIKGQPWGHGHINTYVLNGTKHVNCIVFGGGKNWKNGEWRMIACTYSGGNISCSVNAGRTSASVLTRLMTQPPRVFNIGTERDENAQYRVLVDEVVVFKRVLTEAELRQLYDASCKIMAEKK